MSDQEVIDRVEGEIMKGRTFGLWALSAGSEIGYRPPTGWRNLAKAMGHLTTGMRFDQAQYNLCMVVMRSMNDALTPGQNIERACFAVVKELQRGWDDIILKASPEPGRYSDWHKEYTLKDRLRFAVTMSKVKGEIDKGTLPGIGWALAGLCNREGVDYDG